MYDHIGIKVKDLETSKRFYAATMTALGHELCCSDDNSAGLGPKDSPSLWLYRAGKSPSLGTHVAFRAPDRAAVDRFHKEGLKHGGSDNGKPGPRVDYSPTYYAAFLIDPDGNNVEAVCFN